MRLSRVTQWRASLFAAAFVLAAPLLAALPRQTPAQAPTSSQTPQAPALFKSGVDIVPIDVQIVDRDGNPITNLTAADFNVTIDNQRREIKSVDFTHAGQALVAAATTTMAATSAPATISAPPAPRTSSSPVESTDRIFILAVDEPSLTISSAQAAVTSMRAFIAKLQPTDLAGIYRYPFGPGSLNVRRDHDAVAKEAGTIVGGFQPFQGQYHMTPSEAIDVTAGTDGRAVAEIIAARCGTDLECPEAIKIEAKVQTAQYEMSASQRVGGLQSLFDSLSKLPGRKTVVITSGGMIAADTVGGRPDLDMLLMSIGASAAAAEANLYILHLDTSLNELFSAANPPPVQRKGGPPPMMLTMSRMTRDEVPAKFGLEMIAGKTNGAYIQIQAGTPDFAFDRVLRETSAYYVLGVEPADADRTGRMHVIHVSVKRKGATIRSRTQVFIPKKPG